MDQAVGNFLGHRRFGVEFAPDRSRGKSTDAMSSVERSASRNTDRRRRSIPEINAIDGVDVDLGVGNMLLPIVVGYPDNLA